MRINRTQDPVLKNRVVFTGEPHPLRWLAIIGAVVMMSFATWAYFYFPQFSKTTTLVDPTVKTPLSVATANLPPIKMNHAAGTIVNSEQPQLIEVPPVVQTDKQSTTDEQLLLSANNSVVSSAANSTSSATLETPVELPSELAPTQEKALLPSPPVKPAANEVKPPNVPAMETVANSVKTTPTLESPVVAEPNTDKSTQITQLLAQAQSQLKLTRLTSPQGDNAYETYQTLRKIAPQEAESILDNIIAWYYEQGQKYLQRNRLTSPPENNAYHLYQKMTAIAPQHPGATQLLQGIIEQLQQQFDKQFQRRQWLTPAGYNAYTTYQKLLEVTARPQDIQPLRNKLVKQLLLEAERQLTEEKYTSPRPDNAVDTYRKILAIAPKQVEAQQGIKKIVEEYYQKALQQQREEHYRSSLIWVKRGLKIAPDDPQLNQLKRDLEDNLSH